MPPWASHHVMLEVAGHTGQTTFPNTRLHEDRPASPTFIFSSGFKKPSQKNPSVWYRYQRTKNIKLTLTARTDLLVRLLWCHWGPGMHMLHWSGASGHTIHHQATRFPEWGLLVIKLKESSHCYNLSNWISAHFGENSDHQKLPKHLEWGSFEVVLIQQDSLRWSFSAQEQHWNQALGSPRIVQHSHQIPRSLGVFFARTPHQSETRKMCKPFDCSI